MTKPTRGGVAALVSLDEKQGKLGRPESFDASVFTDDASPVARFVLSLAVVHNDLNQQLRRAVSETGALGRKNFLFVGSEQGGKAAAIYFSLIASRKLNKVNPLSYMTYLLDHARTKTERPLLPTDFDGSHIAHIG